jgi:copper chaperone CopZ
MSDFKINISGVTCGGCVASIKNTLSDLQQIQSIDVNPSTGEANLSLSDDMTLKTVIEKINDLGKFQVLGYELIN